MSNKAMTWAMDQEILSSSQKFVLIVLGNFCNDTGKSHPGVWTICKITALHEDTVRKSIECLVKDGFVKDTGKNVGTTGRVKVYEFPECCVEIPRKTGVLNTPKNHVIKNTTIPEQSPSNPRAIPDSSAAPIYKEPLTLNPEYNKGDDLQEAIALWIEAFTNSTGEVYPIHIAKRRKADKTAMAGLLKSGVTPDRVGDVAKKMFAAANIAVNGKRLFWTSTCQTIDMFCMKWTAIVSELKTTPESTQMVCTADVDDHGNVKGSFFYGCGV